MKAGETRRGGTHAVRVVAVILARLWPHATTNRAAVLAVAFGAAVALSAQAAEPGQAPDEDAIAAAKRQLDALKVNAGSAAVGTSQSGLPRMGVPQLETVPGGAQAVPRALTPEQEAAEKRKENWLVEGMKDQDESRRKQARGRKDSFGDEHDVDPESRKRVAGGIDAKESKDDLGEKQVAMSQVVNPLGQYLTDWLSPQDAVLLRQTLERANAPTSSAPVPAAADAVTGSTLESVLAGMQTGPSTRVASGSQPAENPYLEALKEVYRPPPPAVAPPTQPLVSTPPVPALTPPPAPTSKPTVPDFAKPADDNKYFKPLKRF